MCCEYVWVVLNSGMKNTVAQKIMDRVWPRLINGEAISEVFKHKGKVAAIEHVWKHRVDYFACFKAATDVVGWCASLPWIGAHRCRGSATSRSTTSPRTWAPTSRSRIDGWFGSPTPRRPPSTNSAGASP